MQKSIIEELIEKKSVIAREKSAILREMIQHKGSMRKHGEVIQQKKEEIKQMLHDSIFVNVETIVKNIAKIWNAKVEDLDVNVEFPTTEIIGKATKKEMASIFGARTDRSIRILVEFLGQWIVFSSVLDLNAIQKNGENLYNCLDVEHKESDGYCKTNFVCPNYRDLTFKFYLNTLINFETNEYEGDLGRAVMTAYEQDKAKEIEGNI